MSQKTVILDGQSLTIQDIVNVARNGYQVELTEQERSKTDNSIINLQNYLRTQKRIFEEAA